MKTEKVYHKQNHRTFKLQQQFYWNRFQKMVCQEQAIIHFLTPSGTHVSLLYAQLIQNLELEHTKYLFLPVGQSL